jgi:hypothetical protein
VSVFDAPIISKNQNNHYLQAVKVCRATEEERKLSQFLQKLTNTASYVQEQKLDSYGLQIPSLVFH